MAVIFINEGELQLGTQQLVSFGSRKADVGTNDCALALLGCRCVLAFLGPLRTVAIVRTALTCRSHIRHCSQNGMLAGLGHIFFTTDGDIKNLIQNDRTNAQNKAQQETNERILGVAGRTGSGRHNGRVHDLCGSSINDGADSLGKDIGNGIGQSFSLLRILAGNGNAEDFRFIDRTGTDHLFKFPVCTGSTCIIDDVHQRFSGVENDDVGIDQISGGCQVTGRNTDRGISQR